MEILVVGLNHEAAPVEVRERLAFGGDALPRSLAHLRSYVEEGVVLSTCNRTEVYGLAGAFEDGRQHIVEFLATERDVPASEFTRHLYTYCREAAVRHLFRVASGLDSMIVGEPQILGQVKGAYDAARDSKAAGSVLSKLFLQAATVGKRAHSETDIGRSAVSVSYAAVELARKIFSDLRRCSCLIIGAGEMGTLALKTLMDNGVPRATVTNRTYETANNVASAFGDRAKAVEFERLPEALSQTDIVISSTASPDFVLTADKVRSAMRSRGNRPLFLIDIAVPRDIDPKVGRMDGVFLYDVDDLKAVCDANLQERSREAVKVESIIKGEVAAYMRWWDARAVVPTIVALREWAESIREAEVAKALRRMHNLSDRDRVIINALSSSIVNKLLHPPTVGLKEQEDGRCYVEAIRELFRLDERKR